MTRPDRSPYDSLMSGEELIDAERLAQVIVGAVTEPLDALANPRPGRQHENGDIASRGAQLVSQDQAAAVRQVQVQYYRRVAPGGEGPPSVGDG